MGQRGDAPLMAKPFGVKVAFLAARSGQWKSGFPSRHGNRRDVRNMLKTRQKMSILHDEIRKFHMPIWTITRGGARSPGCTISPCIEDVTHGAVSKIKL